MTTIHSYDDNNIFARILRGDLPYDMVHETEFALAFHDINPQAPVHVLVIPKGQYVSMDDFTEHASTEEIVGFTRAIGETAKVLGLPQDGYRTVTNIGIYGMQEVPHLHTHVFGGKPLGTMLKMKN